ncbi:MAG TPA: SGNH/GDSL hydrolase family protein [Candidatus Babeliales bacterium]|nr:SGNH/GDSL hydrolase family protein [Candidatus Babeliales bacterium]
MLACILLSGKAISSAGTGSPSSWLSSPLYLNKTKDVTISEIPTTLWSAGNTDCTNVYDASCSIDTAYGQVYNSSLWVDGKWQLLKDYAGNTADLFAIPYSDTLITSSSSPVFGSNLFFTNDVSSSLTPHYAFGAPDVNIATENLDYLQLNRNFDSQLTDKAGRRLAADLNSMAFSGDSSWMIVTDPNIATLRVNLKTFEVLPFGRTFIYGNGLNPVPKNAVSSDGRYAVLASQDTATFAIYDLSTCNSAPLTISQPVSCQAKELLNSGFMNSHIPGYSGTRYIRFINENTLNIYASYKEGNVTKFAQYVLSTDPTPTKLQYLALGDSYISGEGTFDYFSGTDTNANKCHTSPSSYPYLMGQELSFDSYHSVACSGATTDDIINESLNYTGQADNHQYTRLQRNNQAQTTTFLDSFSPGYIDQLDFVKMYQPKTVTISVGGNDMGFSGILKVCVSPTTSNNTCYSTYEDRLELVRQINSRVFPNLVRTYTKIKSTGPADMRLYVIGYPQIALTGGDCAVNVHLNNDELIFAQQLINYLDLVIKQAAVKAGAKYVDTEHALDGHRLCEPGTLAMNALTIGNDRPKQFGGPLADESYHPNKYGHQLLETDIIKATHNLTDLMPNPDPSVTPPDEVNLEILNAQHSGRPINNTYFAEDISNDVEYRDETFSLSTTNAPLLKPSSKVEVVLHSNTVNLGEFMTDQYGKLNVSVSLPSGVMAGFHTLHIYGKDIANQLLDIFKVIYVADNLNSAGPTKENPCVVVPSSGLDYDGDEIDDACDGDIAQPTGQGGSIDNPRPSLINSPVSTNLLISAPSILNGITLNTRSIQIQQSIPISNYSDNLNSIYYDTIIGNRAVLGLKTSKTTSINQSLKPSTQSRKWLSLMFISLLIYPVGRILKRRIKRKPLPLSDTQSSD